MIPRLPRPARRAIAAIVCPLVGLAARGLGSLASKMPPPMPGIDPDALYTFSEGEQLPGYVTPLMPACLRLEDFEVTIDGEPVPGAYGRIDLAGEPVLGTVESRPDEP